MASNSGKVALVVGASRGIGRQIAIDVAKDGYSVVVAAKSTSDAQSVVPFPPDPNSPQSTISTVEREIVEAGGRATAIPVDVRDFASVQKLVDRTVETYGRLDVLVYNSGAIWWASVEDTPMKRFQLMQRVNPEGLYGAVQAALPHLKQHRSGRIVVVSPPIYSRFFRGKTGYAIGKIGMSVLTKGLAMDFERQGLADMAITSLWPAVAIESAATRKMTDASPAEARDLRKATIFSDAVLAVLRAPAAVVNGNLELDEDFLRSAAGGGVTDFARYAVVPGTEPRRIMPAALPDLTVPEQNDEGKRMNSAAGGSGGGSKL
ncbi:short chain dehydrogenase family protein [Hypomontagnella monticulosa]|nr:short chain dehydrogenase family protein [Hypomontagnella monticulosa]